MSGEKSGFEGGCSSGQVDEGTITRVKLGSGWATEGGSAGGLGHDHGVQTDSISDLWTFANAVLRCLQATESNFKRFVEVGRGTFDNHCEVLNSKTLTFVGRQ